MSMPDRQRLSDEIPNPRITPERDPDSLAYHGHQLPSASGFDFSKRSFDSNPTRLSAGPGELRGPRWHQPDRTRSSVTRPFPPLLNHIVPYSPPAGPSSQ